MQPSSQEKFRAKKTNGLYVGTTSGKATLIEAYSKVKKGTQ